MLKFKKEKAENDEIIYKYFPEGGTEFGIIKMSKNKKLISKETASNDSSEWYAGHLMSRMREMIEKSDFPNEGMIAWY